MRKFFNAAVAVGVMTAGAASAATTTTSFTVSATVQSACTATATPIAFGTYTPGGGALSNNGSISVKCTKSTPFSVALNAGSTAGDAFAQRLMAPATGTGTLQYNLYTGAGFATVFGDGTGGSANITGTGLGVATANTFTVYGQLPDSAANQLAVPGAYSDTITVTVTY